jgi:glycosyltransferase involved in cell wall biosynthesis
MDVSVIICSYNGASIITPTVEHLAKQKLGGLNCELLLVDNNCSDDTVEVVQRVWADNESPFPLMIINERIPGLSNARKAGILAAQGEIVVFCDDDNWLNDDYLSNAFRIFQTDKMIFGVCGYCHPIAFIPLPDWFNKYAILYACGLPQLDNNHLITLRGAGMVIRAKILKALYTEGISHFTSGRKGKSLESGEDDEISFWLKSVGGKLLYSESLQLKHFMEEMAM